MEKDQLIVALDVPSASEAMMWARKLHNRVGCFKIGLQLYCAHGPELVRKLADSGMPVFLDLKLHDIPNTVRGAIRSLSALNLQFLTLHVQGGAEMIEAAVDALPKANAPQLLGVTILTSLNDRAVGQLGYGRSASEQAVHLASLGAAAGLDGFVCSPLEVAEIRRALPQARALVTPGVRPEGSDASDQSRISTPETALSQGATHVVIGRPILQAERPEAVIDQLLG